MVVSLLAFRVQGSRFGREVGLFCSKEFLFLRGPNILGALYDQDKISLYVVAKSYELSHLRKLSLPGPACGSCMIRSKV